MLSRGTDILADVDDVVPFMTPEALSVWIQRAGRAGRQSRGILLVEPSVGEKFSATSLTSGRIFFATIIWKVVTHCVLL